MPRNIDELRKQYNSSQTQSAQRGGPGGGPGGGRNNPGRQQGKPKDARKTIARLFTYLHGQRVRLVFVLLCMLFTTLTSLVGGYLTAPIIDRLTLAVKPDAVINMTKVEIAADGFIRSVLSAVFGGAEATAFQYIIAAVTILGVVYVIGIATSYIQAKLMMHITQNFLTDIRNDLFTKLQRLPVRYFDSKPVGEIMSRFTNDIDNLDSMVSNSLTSIISGTVTLIGTFIFMITTSWILTLVTVVFIPVFMFGGLLLAKRSRKYYSSQQAALGAINGYMEETVTGQKVIKVFNHEDECEEEFGLLNDDMRDKQFKAQFWGGIMGPVMGNMSQISYAVTVGVGGILMLAGYLTPGGLSIFARYARQFAMPINQLSQQMATVFSALAGAERVFEVMDTDPEKPDVPDAKTMDGMQGYVVLENVTFGYVPGKTVLKNISLYAKPGQKIAFVGSTGAGKTTVTNLISRFYDVEEGTITIDGVDIRDIKRDELRSHIAMVLQDTHLFTGTVMENIRYGRLDATDEEVIAAAKTASAHSFIMRLSDGYNTMLEGDGANLSQGQRQLLAI
ncbi:MAG: ABC transporter ATP-binding protein, partial [Clostridia bacterium]|nr:ABC transporter ATP-binding protein [Clostridia bacterium]